jgi:ankyrin repeat protein
MDKGVDRNKPNNEGYTPLFIAAALSHVAVVKRLLDNGADMNKARNDGMRI